MTFEHPGFSKNISQLTVLVTTDQGNHGTGLLYFSQNSSDRAYVITAKHCLQVGNGGLALVQDVSISRDNGQCMYKLDLRDRILAHPSVDLAILILPKEVIFTIFENPPSLLLSVDNGGETATFFYGYPKIMGSSRAIRVNATLLPPINDGIITLDSPLRSETELTENTVVGFSGSAICLLCAGNIYVVGIVTEISEWNRFVGLSITFLNDLLRTAGMPLEVLHNLETNPELVQSHRILNGNSKSLLNSIDETVGGIHVERPVLLEDAMRKLDASRVLLVSGVAGAGKSTFCKILLESLEDVHNAKVISFSGSQVCQANALELLALLNVPSTLEELMDSREMNGLKVIYIDSAEKGFEYQQLEVIKELIRLTKTHQQLKLILSIRSYALTLSTFGLFSATDVSWEELSLEQFDDEEIQPILRAFPGLVTFLKNKKIESFVRTPFYLNLLISLIEETNGGELDELTLKNKLWDKVIRKDSHTRERIFENIALRRNRQLAPFVFLTEDASEPEVKAMLSDHVIREYLDTFGIRSYAPAHDILEDWALVRYMRKQYTSHENLTAFIAEVGDTYQMRRGFRFWLQEVYRIDSEAAKDVTVNTLKDGQVSGSWKDEVIIALLNSNQCLAFLESNQKILMADDVKLLVRCIHLVRTSCKSMTKLERTAEYSLDERKYITSELLPPVGPGWNALVIFIRRNFSALEKHYPLIISFLQDWGRAEQTTLKAASADGASIILQLITLYRKKYASWGDQPENNWCKKLTELLFNLTAENLELVEKFIRTSFDKVCLSVFGDDDADASEENLEKQDEFDRLVLKTSLNYYTSEVLARCLPGLVWEIAIFFWTDAAELAAKAKQKQNEDQYPPRISDLIDYHREPEDEELFGLSEKGRRDFYPVSAFHTPFSHLLKYHPQDAVRHFSSFMNRSVNCYRNLKPLELKPVLVKLSLEEAVIQYGNQSLWDMYRGHHFGPDLLKCLHMALENFLLELAASKQEGDVVVLKQIISQLFRENISISVTAVIASVAAAYPFVVGEHMLPLFSVKDIFQWDLHRMVHEREVFTPFDQSGKNPGAQQERIKSKGLPHREGKLEFLVFKMSFYRGFAETIFQFLDDFNTELESGIPEDYPNWPYVLLRLDRRKYKVTSATAESIIIEPELPLEMQQEKEAAMKELQADSGITVWNWCHLILDKDQQENNTIDNWKHFLKLSKAITASNSLDNTLYNSPMGLAEIGLRYYYEDLSRDEMTWCIDTTIAVVSYFLEKDKEHFNMGFGKYAHWNRDIGYPFLPFLLQSRFGQEVNDGAKVLLRSIVANATVDDGLSYPLFEKIAKACWENDYDFALSCFQRLLEKAVGMSQLSERGASANEPGPTDRNFNDSYNCLFNLDKAFLFLTEALTINEQGHNFLSTYQQFLIGLTIKDQPGYRRRPQSTYYSSHIHYQFKYGKMMILIKSAEMNALFTALLVSFLSVPREDMLRLGQETFKFCNECIKDIISFQDKNEDSERFQDLWLLLLANSLKFDRFVFINKVFLNWYWKDSADTWPAIHKHKKFYLDLLEHIGPLDLDSSVALMAGIGFDDLFPESLALFSRLIDNSDSKTWAGRYDSEKFIQRAFYLKGNLIKANANHKKHFLNILDQLINSGSSISYLIKEGFISA